MAGPISLGLVHLSNQQLADFESGIFLEGLNDSKKLRPQKRKKLNTILENQCFYRHTFISHKSIDRFGLSLCICKGIERLVRGLDRSESIFLIDGNYKFEKFLKAGEIFFYRSIVKGDSRVPSIAAASIIAKERRDAYMRVLSSRYPEYGFHANMGYGTKNHVEAIRKHGVCKFHRKSFLKETMDSPGLFN